MLNIIIGIAGLLYVIFGTQFGDNTSCMVIGGLSGYILGDGIRELRKQ